jgi:hypothetical protein
VLEELIALYAVLELLLGEKVVLTPILLTRPAWAGRRGDGNLEIRPTLEQRAD